MWCARMPCFCLLPPSPTEDIYQFLPLIPVRRPSLGTAEWERLWDNSSQMRLSMETTEIFLGLSFFSCRLWEQSWVLKRVPVSCDIELDLRAAVCITAGSAVPRCDGPLPRRASPLILSVEVLWSWVWTWSFAGSGAGASRVGHSGQCSGSSRGAAARLGQQWGPPPACWGAQTHSRGQGCGTWACEPYRREERRLSKRWGSAERRLVCKVLWSCVSLGQFSLPDHWISVSFRKQVSKGQYW